MEEHESEKVGFFKEKLRWLRAVLSPVIFLLENFLGILKGLFLTCKGIALTFSIKHWRENYKLLGPQTIGAFILAFMVCLLGIIFINERAKEFVEKVSRTLNPKVEVAEVLDVVERPRYYRKNEKTFLVKGVTLPIFLKKSYTRYPAGKGRVFKNLIVDISIVSSNRYVKAYFSDRRTFLIKDRLNTKIKPIPISFPLEEEGKIILKEKFKKEINSLIKELNIKGSIEEIHIERLVAA